MPPPDPAKETALIVKLKALGADCEVDQFMTLEQRRDAVHKALELFDGVTYTVRNGRRITMAMQFADVYGMVP